MGRFLLKRLFATVIVILAVSIIVFILMRLAPGNPAEMMLPESATEESIAAMEVKLGLDKHPVYQYFIYLKDLLRGDLGTSIQYNQPVAKVISERLPATLWITLYGGIAVLIISIPLGITAGVKKGSFGDFFAVGFTLLGQSMSVVWLSILLIFVFSVKLGWLPPMGYNGPDLKFLILPVIAFSYKMMAIVTRMARSGMIDVMSEDYITCAYAKGESDFSIYTKYAFKNAMIPVVTVYGLQIAAMLAGGVIIETAFALPGIGSMLVRAVGIRDYPLVQSTLVVTAAIYAVINLIVDIINSAIDRRMLLN